MTFHRYLKNAVPADAQRHFKSNPHNPLLLGLLNTLLNHNIPIIKPLRLNIPTPLQTLHLPRLQRAQILSSQVHPTDLVTHRIRLDVLLGPLLGAARLPHGLLARRLVGLLDASDAEVHAGSHLLDLDARELLA